MRMVPRQGRPRLGRATFRVKHDRRHQPRWAGNACWPLYNWDTSLDCMGAL